MSDDKTAVAKRDKTEIEYVPLGANDKVKLTVNIVQKLIAVPTRSGKTCSETDAIKFVAMCQAKRMNPFEGDCFLIGYDGREGTTFTMVTAHQTYLKRAELHPEFDGMESGVIVEEGGKLVDLVGDFYTPPGQKLVGGWATVHFRNRKHPMTKRLRLARFQKTYGIWQEDPAGMICKCAEADALRSSFPTMLGGLYLREELESKERTEFNRPLFNGMQAPAITDVQQLPPTQARPEPEPEPPPPSAAPGPEPEPKPEPAKSAYNTVRAIRGMMKLRSLTEAKILSALAELGVIPDDVKTLEEMMLGFPAETQMLHDQFADIAAKVAETGGAQ